MELWTVTGAAPGGAARIAQRAEADGWHGLGLFDSQNLAADVYVELALAASVTTRLHLATAVTNPVTRHPAVTANAIATVHAESGSRAALGIGRGDSSLAHLGLPPAGVARFRAYLERVQGYLRGDEVPFELHEGPGAPVHAGPSASQLHWVADANIGGVGKVVVDVAATGPAVIAAGAVLGDRVSFAVGADPERLRWAMDTARSARAAAELDPATESFGAYVPIVAHEDRDLARQLVAGSVASFARFSVMQGTVTGPLREEQRAVLESVHRTYDMGQHFTHGSPQSAQLTDDVIDTFAIAGPPGYCVDRLREVASLGIARVFVMGAGIGSDRDAQRTARELLAKRVLPAMA